MLQPLKLGELTENGIAVTQEMIEGAKDWVDIVHAVGGERHYEELMPIRDLHATDCGGTPDAWSYSAGTIEVFDYKFGYVRHDPFEHWQLLAYAIGARRVMADRGIIANTFGLHIVQPRSYSTEGIVRSWALTGAQLDEYAERMRKRIAEADAGAAETDQIEQG